MRLDKFLAHAGLGTRKEVKKLVKDKLIKVNDEIAKSDSMHIDPEKDEIYYEDFLIEYHKNIYLMFNKPKNCICANEDKTHELVFDYLSEFEHRKLFTIGRLDIDTTGLLLISDDGEFAHKITNPKKAIFKDYQALIDGIISKADIQAFSEGIIIDEDYKTKPAKLEHLVDDEQGSWVKVSICEGKFHQVKKMLASRGFEVLELNRIKIGNLELDPDLELGEYRFLTDEELKNIF